MVEAASVVDFASPGDRIFFLKHCADLALTWATKALRCSKDAPMFNAGFKRDSKAVSVALPSRAVREPAGLIVPLISHHGAHTVTELSRATSGVGDGRRRTNAACYFAFSIWRSCRRTSPPHNRHRSFQIFFRASSTCSHRQRVRRPQCPVRPRWAQTPHARLNVLTWHAQARYRRQRNMPMQMVTRTTLRPARLKRSRL